MKTIKISDSADYALSKLSKYRKFSGQIVKTKQDIVAELVLKAFNQEIPPIIS